LKEDLPKMVADIRTLQPKMELRITSALGEDAEMLEAMAAWVQRAVR
jgi:hypothetical protein